MSKPATEAALNGLHEALATMLTTAIKGNDCPAAVLAVARGFLKDNEITCVPDENNKMGELEKALAEKSGRAAGLMPDELKDALDNLGGVRVN